MFVRGWVGGSLGGSSCLRSRSAVVGSFVLELGFLRFIDSSIVNGLDRAKFGETGSSTVVVSDIFGPR